MEEVISCLESMIEVFKLNELEKQNEDSLDHNIEPHGQVRAILHENRHDQTPDLGPDQEVREGSLLPNMAAAASGSSVSDQTSRGQVQSSWS